MQFLYPILAWFVRYAVLKIFAILSVGVFTYAIVQFFFEKYVNQGLSHIGGIPADAWALITIANLDKCLSIILGAWSIRAAIAAFKSVMIKI